MMWLSYASYSTMWCMHAHACIYMYLYRLGKDTELSSPTQQPTYIVVACTLDVELPGTLQRVD